MELEVYGNLNNLRLEVNQNMEVMNPNKKILFFIIYINNKIEKLLKGSVCQNAEIVEKFYDLNKIDLSKIKNHDNDISIFRHLNINISLLEVMYKHSLLKIYIDYSKQLEFIDIKISDILLGKNIEINIKSIFEQLEILLKKVNKHHKIHGFLKEARMIQNNEEIYNIKKEAKYDKRNNKLTRLL